MSAYLCDQDTINAIATYAATHGLVEDAALFADLLTLQNVASMHARYAGRDWLKSEVDDVAAAYSYERVLTDARTVAEYAREYDYQACETEDYQATLCHRLVQRVQEHAYALAGLERKGGCGAAVNTYHITARRMTAQAWRLMGEARQMKKQAAQEPDSIYARLLLTSVSSYATCARMSLGTARIYRNMGAR
jgi:hypothetical protein